MRYLLDTDTCVYWLRRQSPVHRHLLAIDPADIAISIITLAELHYGAALSARLTANKQAIDTFAQAIKILDLAPAVVLAFGDIKVHLRKQGQTIADFDLLIAMTARTHNLFLVTNNLRHFRRIPALQLVNWLGE